MDLDKAPPSDPMATGMYMRWRRKAARRGKVSKRINPINPNGVRSWRDEASSFRDKAYEYRLEGNSHFFSVGHCIISLGAPSRRVDIGDGRFWIRIEICDDEERHPNVYATSSTEQDPGRRLAFL
jgi:hypothetical protein